jgi:hypothetical protein
MGVPLPAEIQVTELAGGVRYTLPRRRLGAFHALGFVFIAFGLLFTSVPLFMTGFVLRQWLQAGGPPWVATIFVLFLVPFVVAGGVVITHGVFILAGFCEIEIRDGRLRAVERAGPFRWMPTRPIAVERVRKLVVGAGLKGRSIERPAEHHEGQISGGPQADVGVLLAECAEAKPRALVRGYPCDWLWAVADDLAPRLAPITIDSRSDLQKPVVEVTPAPLDLEAFSERVEQPAGSESVLETHADGLTLTVPPAGIRRGSKGLFFFSLLWLAITLASGGSFVAAVINGRIAGWETLVPVCIIFVFIAVGVGMLLGAINMGRRRAVFAVVGETLMVLQTGIFGSKRREWKSEHIADIRTGPSGMKVNNMDVIELQILQRNGKKFGMLAGREVPELQWLATLLRRALRVPPD